MGGVVGVALIGFLTWFLLKRRRQQREQDQAIELPVGPGEPQYKYSSLTCSPSSQMPAEMPSPDGTRHEMTGNEHMSLEMAAEANRRSELPTE